MFQGKYSMQEIRSWLFEGGAKPNAKFPYSNLFGRNQQNYAPKKISNQVSVIGSGIYTSRMRIHSGGITDICIEQGKTGAVASSNNGDLLTGCGYPIAKAVINAAGAGMQAELYNRYGVSEIMGQPKRSQKKYIQTEGRGYAITCDSYDMKGTHNIEQIEELIVPYASSPQNNEGIINMYYEAFVHCKELDYIILPMVGMSHPALEDSALKSAELVTEAFARFMQNYPTSKLEIIFTIFNDPDAEKSYKACAEKLDASPRTAIETKKAETPVSFEIRKAAREARCAFDISLEDFREKQEQLTLESEDYKQAEQCYYALIDASEEYFASDLNQTNYILFQQKCIQALNVLEQQITFKEVSVKIQRVLGLINTISEMTIDHGPKPVEVQPLATAITSNQQTATSSLPIDTIHQIDSPVVDGISPIDSKKKFAINGWYIAGIIASVIIFPIGLYRLYKHMTHGGEDQKLPHTIATSATSQPLTLSLDHNNSRVLPVVYRPLTSSSTAVMKCIK